MPAKEAKDLQYTLNALCALVGTANEHDAYERAKKIVRAGVSKADAAKYLGLHAPNVINYIAGKRRGVNDARRARNNKRIKETN